MHRRRGALVALTALAALGLAEHDSGATSTVRNGRIAYAHLGASGKRLQIYTTNAGGTHRQHLTRGRRYSSYAPSYSPDGKRIVFVRAFKQGDLWSISSDGSKPRRLTRTSSVSEMDPVWSPDGKKIAYSSLATSTLGIWIVEVDGQSLQRLTTGYDSNPSWSADGSKIVFQRYDPTTQLDAIDVVSVAGGSATTLTNDPGFSDLEPAWSPDASRILFSSDRGDNGESQLDLWIMNADGSNPQRVRHTPSRDEHNPGWSPDGKKIVYRSESSTHGSASYQLYVSNADGSNRRIITHACGTCAIINDDPSWQPLR